MGMNDFVVFSCPWYGNDMNSRIQVDVSYINFNTYSNSLHCAIYNIMFMQLNKDNTT